MVFNILVGIKSLNGKCVQILLQIPQGYQRRTYVTLYVPEDDCAHMDGQRQLQNQTERIPNQGNMQYMKYEKNCNVY